MAREPQHRQHHARDRDPEHQDHEQPKRPYEALRDYFKLRRFRPDFGREFNATNYWGDKDKDSKR